MSSQAGVGHRLQAFGMLRDSMVCLLLLWSLLYAADALAANGAACIDSNRPLRVGVYRSEPFMMEDNAGDYTGMGIDLWHKAAGMLGWNYEYQAMDSPRAMVAALAAGDLDVGITNLTINRQRLEKIDFTQPWYRGGLRIMTYDIKSQKTGFAALFHGLRNSGYLLSYLWLIGIIIVATILLTLFDRYFDKAFPERWREGLAESFYAVMSVVTSGRPPTHKNLFGWVGRVWQGLWLVCGIAIFAYITSTVTSVMTTLQLTASISSIEDLAGETVAVRRGSTADDYAAAVGLTTRYHDDLDHAVAALQEGRVRAIIGDAAVLQYYAGTHPGSGTKVVGRIFSPQSYGFGLQRDSCLRKDLTIELEGLRKTGFVDEVKARYFDD